MALTQISTAGVKDDAITAGKIPANAVATSEIADNAVTEAKIAGASIDEAKLNISNAGSNGQYLQKQSGNTGGLTWAAVPAGVGGATGLDLNDSVELRLGNSQDFRLYHDGTNTQIRNTTGLLTIGTDVFNVYAMSANEVMIRADLNSDVELYYDGSKKLETNADGIKVSGDIVADDNKLIKLRKTWYCFT